MKHIVTCTISLLLTGCAIYTPQVSPPILIKEKGDIQLDIGANVSSVLITPGVNASASIGLTDNVQTQLYTCYISSGTTHFQLLTGYNFKINEKSDFKLMGGYFYGIGNVTYQGIFYGEPITYKGHYKSIFSKIQFSKQMKSPNKIWGFTFTLGNFTPDYSINYNETTEIQTETKKINQKGILFEPYLFYHYKLSDRFGLTLSYSNCWIKPINQLNDDYPNRYDLDYNYWGNIGFTIKYLIKTGCNIL